MVASNITILIMLPVREFIILSPPTPLEGKGIEFLIAYRHTLVYTAKCEKNAPGTEELERE